MMGKKKIIFASLGVFFVLYVVLSIVVRLHITQMAYRFQDLKAYERSLKEEQVRLKAELAKTFAVEKLSLSSYQLPDPTQIVRIP
jgi:hypothetical protein